MLAQRSVYPADVIGSVQSCGCWSPSWRWVKCRWSRLLLVRGFVWITVLEQGYELAAAVEAAIVERLKRAEVAHFDEKGQRVAGRLCWLHTASNSLYTHLFVHPRHGGDALRSAASDERCMIACRPTTGLRTWGVPGAHPARTAWSNGQG